MRAPCPPLPLGLVLFCALAVLGGCDLGLLAERGEADSSGHVPAEVQRVVIHQGMGSVRVVGSEAEEATYAWRVEARSARGRAPEEVARTAMRVTRRREGEGETDTMVFALQEDSHVGCQLRSELVLTLPPKTEVVVEAREGRVSLAGLGANALVCGAETEVSVEQMTGPVQVHLAEGAVTARGLNGERAVFTLTGKTKFRLESCSAPCSVSLERASGTVGLYDLTGGLEMRAQRASLDLRQVTDATLEVNRGDVTAEGMRGKWTLRCGNGDFTGKDEACTGCEAILERGDLALATDQAGLVRLDVEVRRGDVRLERGLRSPVATLDLEARKVRVHGEDEGRTYRAGSGDARWRVEAKQGVVTLSGDLPVAAAPAKAR